jgi:hypothetical protein
MISKSKRILVTDAEIAKAVASQTKQKNLKRIVEILGKPMAGNLFQELAGEIIFLPKKSSLNRISKALIIEKELDGIQEKSPEFFRKIRHLKTLVGMSKASIVRTYHAKKYME